MRAFQSAFNQITILRSWVRGTTGKELKARIGDSTNNNRTLTVKQAIRFLNIPNKSQIKTRHQDLAKVLEITLNILEPEIRKARSSRTDAIDLNELVTTYRNVVMNKRKYRKEIGAAVSKVV